MLRMLFSSSMLLLFGLSEQCHPQTPSPERAQKWQATCRRHPGTVAFVTRVFYPRPGSSLSTATDDLSTATPASQPCQTQS
jgi:hypothetical protein